MSPQLFPRYFRKTAFYRSFILFGSHLHESLQTVLRRSQHNLCGGSVSVSFQMRRPQTWTDRPNTWSTLLIFLWNEYMKPSWNTIKRYWDTWYMIICNYTIYRISLYQYTVNVTVKISFQFAFTAETRWSFTPHHLTGGLMTPVAWSTSRNWLSSCPSIPRRKTLWFMIRFWFVLGIQCVVLFCFQQKICGKKSTCDMCQKAKEKGNTCDSCIAMLSPQCMSVNAKHELRYSGGPD